MTRSESKDSAVGAILVAIFLVACAELTRTGPDSWNDVSRVAAIESVVERGTWRIDESAWVTSTMDKALIRGGYYSDKLPLLNLLGAGVYAVMHWGWGATLAPDCAESGKSCAYYGLTLVTMGLPAAGLVWLFFQFLRKQHIALWTAALATAAMAFGAMVWPFSLVLNHALPSAVALFASLYLLKTNVGRHASVWAGICAALAVSFDILSLFAFLSLAAISIVPFRARLVYFASGAMVPLLATGLLDYQITGTVAPPYLIPGAYAFPGSPFHDAPGGQAASADLIQYGFRMLIGDHGLHAYSPILVLATVGLVKIALTKGHELRWEATSIGAGLLALSSYLVTRTFNFGGAAYGERFFLHVIPLVMIFVAFVRPLDVSRWRRAFALAFGVLFVLSVASGYQGARHPWRYSQPLGYVTRDSATGTIGWRWNTSVLN